MNWIWCYEDKALLDPLSISGTVGGSLTTALLACPHNRCAAQCG
jgi:hypothetical protein